MAFLTISVLAIAATAAAAAAIAVAATAACSRRTCAAACLCEPGIGSFARFPRPQALIPGAI